MAAPIGSGSRGAGGHDGRYVGTGVIPGAGQRPTVALSRRAVLGAFGTAAIAAVLSGCARVASPRSTAAAADRNAADRQADVEAAVQAVVLTRTALARLTATVAAEPALAGRLDPITAMHRAHLRRLVDAVPRDRRVRIRVPAPVVTGGRAEAVTQVRATEADVRDSLVELASQAHSGAFARLLAGMAAGCAQRLHLLEAVR